jgi:hypothetical protein
MLKPEEVRHSGIISHEHKHAHVVLNPRDMSPLQREKLKSVLISIESGKDDEITEEEPEDGTGDHEAGR